MKLLIQLPCHNEAAHIASTLRALPAQIKGVDSIEWLVVDDGSTDDSVDIAKKAGVHYVELLRPQQGLAKAFEKGLAASLSHGADIIVTLDADNQHPASAIPALIEPILNQSADMVIGQRSLSQMQCPVWHKWIHYCGNAVIRCWTGLDIDDAPSGFRAYSRFAARQLEVHTPYTYTIETLFVAAYKGLRVATIPVQARPSLRPSRLIKNVPQYVYYAVWAMLATSLRYSFVKQCTQSKIMKNRV